MRKKGEVKNTVSEKCIDLRGSSKTGLNEPTGREWPAIVAAAPRNGGVGSATCILGRVQREMIIHQYASVSSLSVNGRFCSVLSSNVPLNELSTAFRGSR